VAAASIDFAAIPSAAGADFGDLVAGEVIEIVHARTGYGFADALAVGVPSTALRAGSDVGGGASAVHPGDAIFGKFSAGIREGFGGRVGAWRDHGESEIVTRRRKGRKGKSPHEVRRERAKERSFGSLRLLRLTILTRSSDAEH
jgi:hypothetical protein